MSLEENHTEDYQVYHVGLFNKQEHSGRSLKEMKMSPLLLLYMGALNENGDKEQTV